MDSSCTRPFRHVSLTSPMLVAQRPMAWIVAATKSLSMLLMYVYQRKNTHLLQYDRSISCWRSGLHIICFFQRHKFSLTVPETLSEWWRCSSHWPNWWEPPAVKDETERKPRLALKHKTGFSVINARHFSVALIYLLGLFYTLETASL